MHDMVILTVSQSYECVLNSYALNTFGKSASNWYIPPPPRLGLRSCTEGAEDDGYVLVQLYVPETHTTEFVVLDAQRVDAGPLARIKLRHHIPYGFHGTFTPEVFVDSSHVIRAKL